MPSISLEILALVLGSAGATAVFYVWTSRILRDDKGGGRSSSLVFSITHVCAAV